MIYFRLVLLNNTTRSNKIVKTRMVKSVFDGGLKKKGYCP